MDTYFFDSSAIVKRYVNETGSNFVENLTNLKSGNLVLLARITQVEVASAFARRLKSGSLTQNETDDALKLFQHDLTNNYFVIEVTSNLLFEATRLAIKYALRGYDAVQLASAVETNNERIAQGLLPLILVSADTDLNDAAKLEGFTIENPNNHP
jgi:predicted nucleic acid-binding protein